MTVYNVPITLFDNHGDSSNNAIARRKHAHTAITKATAERFARRPA